MVFFKLIFLFMIGSILGWILELFYRRFFSVKKWINPGFLVGPYLPLYGTGLVLMYSLTEILKLIPFTNNIIQAIVIIILLGLAMTFIEYITGLIFIKGMKLKLWDYSDRWGNIQGIICPLFSLFWTIICALYYFFLHQFVINLVIEFDEIKYILFFIGMFVGFFIVDLVYSFNIANKLRVLAKESKIVIRYEQFKKNIAENLTELKQKRNFIFPFKSEISFAKHLEYYLDKLTDSINNLKK